MLLPVAQGGAANPGDPDADEDIRVRNEETEEQHEFKAGDVIGFSQGRAIRWTTSHHS